VLSIILTLAMFSCYRTDLEEEVRRLSTQQTATSQVAASVAPVPVAAPSPVAPPQGQRVHESKAQQHQQQAHVQRVTRENDSPDSQWEVLDADVEFGAPLSAADLYSTSRGRRRSRSPVIHILPNDDVWGGPDPARRTSPEYLAPLSRAHAASHLHEDDRRAATHKPQRASSNPGGVRPRSLSSHRQGTVNPHLLKAQSELEEEQRAALAEYDRREQERRRKLEAKRERMRGQSRERMQPRSQQPQYQHPLSLYDEEKEFEPPPQVQPQLHRTLNSDDEGFERTRAPAKVVSHRLPLSAWNMEREVAWQSYRAEHARHEADERNHLPGASRGALEQQGREIAPSPTRSTHRFIREERREEERQKLHMRRFGEA
jgi:hypothetical protein